MSETEPEGIRKVSATVQLFWSLGFVVHPDKSVLAPNQKIQYLKVTTDCKEMSVCLTKERADSPLQCCKSALRAKRITIRALAKVIRKTGSKFSGRKILAITLSSPGKHQQMLHSKKKREPDCCTTLTQEAIEELKWWIANVSSACSDVTASEPEITVASDASLLGWV